MSKRGPKPTPTNILDARGSWRAKGRKGEPVPSAGKMTQPPWLGTDGKRMWRELKPLLQPHGWWKPHYHTRIAMLCDSWQGYMDARREIADHGAVLVNGQTASRYSNPAIRHKATHWKEVKDGCAAFGMSPAEMVGMVDESDKAGEVVEGKARFFNTKGDK
jgi:P27 family predicted phage terminase small subunit|tara:strand:- start:29934 stop:30416 length:483 start_codon:yes stop_codon:yes gene_type:complete